MRISENSRMPSALEIYGARRAAAQARAPGAQPPSHFAEAAAATRASTSPQSINAAAIYARRREEARARGRAAGFIR
jgi:hypothetical protein